MNKTGVGVILLVAGVIGLILVYSMRPPSGMMDAFAMMTAGRDRFIKEPFYQILLALAAVVTLLGGRLVYFGLSQGRVPGDNSVSTVDLVAGDTPSGSQSLTPLQTSRNILPTLAVVGIAALAAVGYGLFAILKK